MATPPRTCASDFEPILTRWRDSFFNDICMDLFQSGEPALGIQRVTIRHRLEDINSDMSLLDTEILHLSEELSRLQSIRNGLKRVTDIHEGVLSPIRRLNADVLSIIFGLAHPQYFLQYPPQDSLDTNLTPWTFGRVCRSWRTAAWSQPKLWSRFSVILSSNTHPDAGEIARRFLSRSGQYPLDVYASWSGEELQPPQCVKVINALASHCSHWKTVHLDICRKEDPDDLIVGNLATLTERLPLLETVSLCPATSGSDFDYIALSRPLQLFRDAPRLRQVKIGYFMDVPDTMVLPWAQLTHLNCEKLDHEEIRRILSQTPALISATLSDSPLRFSLVQSFGNRIILPHLTKLCISTPDFLDFLTLPSLKDITLRGWADLRPFSSDLLSLVARSSCAIESMDIAVTGVPESDVNMGEIVLELLRQLPLLRSLTVSFKEMAIHRPLIDALASFAKPLLQNLEVLKIEFYQWIREPELMASMEEYLLNAIDARRKPLLDTVLPLRELGLTFPFCSSPAVRARVEVWRQEGLEVELKR